MTKRYTDREVSLILQRALEPEAGSAEAGSDDPGLSLEQLKEVAAEVGIDPQRIDLAASSLIQPSPASVNPFAGIPTTVQYQTTVPGKDITGIPTHEVTSVIRSSLGRQGILNSPPGSFEWRARDAFGGRYVSISPTPDGMRLSVLGNYRDGLFTSMMGVGGVIFVGAAAILSGVGFGSAGILIGAAAVALIPPRFAYRWWRRREDATMAALHARLVSLLNAGAEETETEGMKSIPPPTTPA
jgi:hypothetical protein